MAGRWAMMDYWDCVGMVSMAGFVLGAIAGMFLALWAYFTIGI